MTHQGTLYGSLTSPYVRLCRIVRRRAGVAELFPLETISGFDDGIRKVNPLGKVPALIMRDGTALLETTLIIRTLNAYGKEDLFPASPHECLTVEADLALAVGMLDLGVAHFLEKARSDAEISERWQTRRVDGLAAALPALNEAARRALADPTSVSALAITVTADWLSFRLAELIDWRGKAPTVFKLADALLDEDDIAATDPRLA